MNARITTATGTTLIASKNLGANATHVVIAHDAPFWDMIAERDAKLAKDGRAKDANRFGLPQGDTHILSRHTSEKAAQAAARKAAKQGQSVEVAELIY